jgi:RND family efflux transporter MFP subunit
MKSAYAPIACLTALVCLVPAACGRKKEAGNPKQQQAVVVTLTTPEYRPVQRTVDVVGNIYGQEEATISAKVPGRIEAVYKDIGDAVGPGELLAQIEQTDYKLGQQQKSLAIRETLAKLGLTKLPSAQFDTTLLPTVHRAKLQADNAEARYQRGKQLHDQTPPLMSDQDFADLRTTWEVAQSNYEVEKLAAESLIADAASRQAELEIADQRLADTAIRSPATQPAGAPLRYYVGGRMVSTGEYVKEGAALFRLVADDEVKLRANVPERCSKELRVGQEVGVRVEGHERDFVGQITRINPQIDLANRTFQIEARIPNPQRLLKSGAFARASILTHRDDKVLFVKQEAVMTFAGESRVFRIENNVARQIDVDLGQRQGDMVEITTGLDGPAPVVLTGVSKLATGVPVQVKSPGPAAATRPVTQTAETPARS